MSPTSQHNIRIEQGASAGTGAISAFCSCLGWYRHYNANGDHGAGGTSFDRISADVIRHREDVQHKADPQDAKDARTPSGKAQQGTDTYYSAIDRDFIIINGPLTVEDSTITGPSSTITDPSHEPDPDPEHNPEPTEAEAFREEIVEMLRTRATTLLHEASSQPPVPGRPPKLLRLISHELSYLAGQLDPNLSRSDRLRLLP
jgi:hypothetical protein